MPEDAKITYPCRHLHVRVYCSTVHKSQVMESPRCPSTDKHGMCTEWRLSLPGKRITLCSLLENRQSREHTKLKTSDAGRQTL